MTQRQKFRLQLKLPGNQQTIARIRAGREGKVITPTMGDGFSKQSLTT